MKLTILLLAVAVVVAWKARRRVRESLVPVTYRVVPHQAWVLDVPRVVTVNRPPWELPEDYTEDPAWNELVRQARCAS